MKKPWRLLVLFIALSALFLTGCTEDAPELENAPWREMERESDPREPELGPNGRRMIHLTEEAQEIALEDFDYLVEIILANAPTQGIAYRRLGISLEDFLGFVRLAIEEKRPLESLTALIMDERWENIPHDPLYIAADYLTTLLLSMSVFDLRGLGHFGPQSLESYESMFLGNSVIYYDPEAADFTGDIRNTQRILSYFSAPATLWFYGTDPSTFDLTTDLSDVGTREEDNIRIEMIEPGSVAYIHIASFLNSPSFDSEILFPFFEEIQDYEHLIIDIRGNGGGWADYVRSYVVARLIDEPVYLRYYELHMSGPRSLRAADYSMCEYCREREAQRPIAYVLAEEVLDYFNEDDLAFLTYAILRESRIDPAEDNTPFGGKIWLLIDNHTASASEIFAMISLYSGFATVVGEATAGVTGVMTTFVSLPHTGVLFRVDLGSKIDAYGRAIEEYGIQPEIEITPGDDALEVVLELIGLGRRHDAPLPLEEAIIGSWQCLDDTVPHIWLCFLVFDANGRFVDKDGDAGSFHISGNTLTLDFDTFLPMTYTIRIQGDQLILTGEGANITLTREGESAEAPEVPEAQEIDLVGTWECRDDTDMWVSRLVFDTNGRFVDNDGDPGSFSIRGNTLIFDFDDFAAPSFTFYLRDDMLILTGAGLRVVLFRQ